MALPKKQRLAQFDKLRKEGIFIYNRKIQGRKTDLMRERRQGNEDLVICCGCQGFFSKRRIYQHKKKCADKGLCGFKDVAVPQNVSLAGVVSAEFLEKVVSFFRQDAVGNICRSDHAVLLLGDRLWAKSIKKEKRVIMSDMRILGNLIHKMEDVRGSDFSGEDILKRSNFDDLKECILNLTTTETGEMKAGLKVTLGFVLKKLVKIMKGQYIMKNMMKEPEEVDLFSSVLTMSWDFIFYTAQVFCESRRNTLRKPGDMPLEKDVQTFRNFILSQMKVMVQKRDQEWDKHRFIKLRNLICTRLTLFNARRGGEPARMLLSDWTDAEKNAWIDPQLVQNVSDPLEKSLLNQFKIVYQSGKGSRRLVPVLIPNDTVEPLRILAQKREQCDIPESNIFLFPSTGSSKDHVSGWNIMKDVTNLVDGLERPELLIADKFKHRASTLFALTEVPEEKRHAFYKHMGHSQQINRDVYQCPLAVKEVTQVGKFLDTLDQETHETPETHTDETESTEGSYDGTELPTADVPQENACSNISSKDNLEMAASKKNITTNATESTKTRRYVQWKEHEYELVKRHFRSYIEDRSAVGVKGPLPGKSDLLSFLKQNPILGDHPDTKRVAILKTKIFNERKKYRKVFNYV